MTPSRDAHQWVASMNARSWIPAAIDSCGSSCQVAPWSEDRNALGDEDPPSTTTSTSPPGIRATLVKYSPRCVVIWTARQLAPPSEVWYAIGPETKLPPSQPSPDSRHAGRCAKSATDGTSPGSSVHVAPPSVVEKRRSRPDAESLTKS